MKNAKRIIFLFLILINKNYEVFSDNKFGPKYKIISGTDNIKFYDEDQEKDLEYPKNNEEAFKRVQEKWKNYYACLVQNANVEKMPEVRHVVEGQYTELVCDVCPRPFQNYQGLEWKYKPLTLDVNIVEPDHLDLTSEMVLTNSKTLKIFNAVKDFSGLYVCYHGRNPVSVYILEVSTNDTMEKVSNSENFERGIIHLEGISLKAYSQWSEWTECSSCGTIGKKFKYGTCMVTVEPNTNYSTHLIHKRTLENVVSNTTKFLNKYKKYIPKIDFSFLHSFMKSRNITHESHENLLLGTQLIYRFQTGMPCLSPMLPKEVTDLFQNLSTALHVVTKFCSEPCPESEVFEVLDNYGRVIEVANNSAGIYSALQKIPRLPPDLERRSVSAEFGRDVIIQCPGTSLKNVPITWKINKKTVYPKIVANESNGRFIIDYMQRIHIKKLRLKDTRIYSCWQRDKLVGTVHLNVEKKFTIGFDHHVTLIGMLAVVLTFLFVGVKVLTREIKMRKR